MKYGNTSSFTTPSQKCGGAISLKNLSKVSIDSLPSPLAKDTYIQAETNSIC